MSDKKPRRLSDLESILLWEGEIDNQRIREIFGVKTVQASRLLTELAARMDKQISRVSAHAPLKLIERAARKAGKISPEKYLQIISSSSASSENRLLLEDTRLDLSIVEPTIFSPVLQAMRKRLGVQIVYRSMSHPNGLTRTVFPHVLVRSPRRWHIRAWCSLREEFRDFTLGRISQASLLPDISIHTRDADKEWNELVALRIVAHPRLTPAQQEMVASEYFPGENAMQVKVRKCLVKYVVQDLRLSVNLETQLPPDYQLFVQNANGLSLL